DGKLITVTKEITTTDNVTWVQFNLNGTTVFMDKTLLLQQQNQEVTVINRKVVNYNATIIVDQSSGQGINANQPYLVPGSTFYGWANQYSGQKIQVIAELVTSNAPDIVWIEFKLNNTIVFIDKSCVIVG
ncbi:GW dipeptide domain-containing protein, partial [Weissella diestrammenae]